MGIVQNDQLTFNEALMRPGLGVLRGKIANIIILGIYIGAALWSDYCHTSDTFVAGCRAGPQKCNEDAR